MWLEHLWPSTSPSVKIYVGVTGSSETCRGTHDPKVVIINKFVLTCLHKNFVSVILSRTESTGHTNLGNKPHILVRSLDEIDRCCSSWPASGMTKITTNGSYDITTTNCSWFSTNHELNNVIFTSNVHMSIPICTLSHQLIWQPQWKH